MEPAVSSTLAAAHHFARSYTLGCSAVSALRRRARFTGPDMHYAPLNVLAAAAAL